MGRSRVEENCAAGRHLTSRGAMTTPFRRVQTDSYAKSRAVILTPTFNDNSITGDADHLEDEAENWEIAALHLITAVL